MTVEYGALVVIVFLLAAVVVWNKIRSGSRMRAIETRLKKMQREINVLQMQESRRLIMEMNGNSKAAPEPDSDDAPGKRSSGDVVPLMRQTPSTKPEQ